MESPERLNRRLVHSSTYWLAVATVIGIFVVNTLGFTDTITGSAMGCGRNWPLCNGQVIPAVWGRATVIEYTHRVSVVLGGTLLIWLAIAALRKYGKEPGIRSLVVWSLLGVVLEATLGALSVIFVNPPWVMAAHMGIALVSFVAVVLLTSVIGKTEWSRTSKRSPVSAQRINGKAVGRFAWSTLASIPYGYVAIYIGAYVASTGDGAFFRGWPVPAESPGLAGPAFSVDVLHRSVALGYVLWMGWLVWQAYRLRHVRRDWFLASSLAFALVCVQAGTGALLIVTHLSTGAFLLHVTNVSVLFATQCYLGFHLWRHRTVLVPRRGGGDLNEHGDPLFTGGTSARWHSLFNHH